MKLLYFILFLVVLNGCIETFEFEVKDSEQTLAIDASFTNERKAHEVKLAFTHPLNQSEEIHVSAAKVWIEDNEGQIIDFQEDKDGIYRTSPHIMGKVGNTYQLHILTPEGEEFTSTKELLRPSATIEKLYGTYIERPSTENAEIEKGIQFFISTQNDHEPESFYRFDYQEDYEQRVQFSSNWRWNAELETIEPYEIGLDKSLCYKRNPSNQFILETTSGLIANQLPEQPILFISESDEQLRYKYSLKVRQYTISPQAYEYYTKLRDNNQTGGSFFDHQKGTVRGNISKTNDLNYKVLGYFEVAGVAEEYQFFPRYVFVSQGYMPDAEFPYDCLQEPSQLYGHSRFRFNIRTYARSYPHYEIINYTPGVAFFDVIANSCSDCRVHGGELRKPEFWD